MNSGTEPAQNRYLSGLNFIGVEHLDFTTRHAKRKAIPLGAWTGPGGSRRMSLPDFKTVRQIKVVRFSALSTGYLYPPRNIPGTRTWQTLSRPQGHGAAGRIMNMKNSNFTFGNRTPDLPAFSAVSRRITAGQINLKIVFTQIIYIDRISIA